MKLYHFTPLDNYQVMASHKVAINPGAVAMPDGSLQQDFAVSLTKSELPHGMGIPTGRPIPAAIFQKLMALGGSYSNHQMINGVPHQIDHSEVRLRVNIPNSQKLVSVKQFYSKGNKVLAGLALAASEPFGISHLTEAEIDLLIDAKKLDVDKLTRSWWYHLGPIPWGCVDEVAIKQPKGFYKKQ